MTIAGAADFLERPADTLVSVGKSATVKAYAPGAVAYRRTLDGVAIDVRTDGTHSTGPLMKRLMFVLAVLLAAGAASAARVGIMTDTHVGHEGKATSERLERCYRHFKNHQVDMIFHLGDIADYHDPDFYREYVAIRAKVYPTNCPLGAALSSRLCHGATADALK